MVRKQISKDQAIQRLETLCVRGEQCRFDLQEKLRRWGIFQSEIDGILDSLEDRNFFSDARFASAFAHDKLLFNRWGRMKIVMALRAKRIASNFIDDALEAIEDEEYERVLRDFLVAKARSIKEGFSYEGRTKLYRAAIARGFESQLAAKVVKDPAIWPRREDEDDE